jgi:protein AaeX
LKFFEINLLGVYVAPMSILMLAAGLATLVWLRVAGRFGLLRFVWHPALFVLALYMIALSSMLLAIAR